MAHERLPDNYRRKTLNDLKSGERGIVEVTAMLVMPNGEAFVDQHIALCVVPPVACYIMVQRTNTGCIVNLTNAGGHKWTPRPINFDLYDFDLWGVQQFAYS